jgi:dTDP-3-amino-3,4,6-trideoxy-alpha-D-glucose transaminase
MTASALSGPTADVRGAAEPIPFVRLDADDPDLFGELMDAARAVAARSAFILGDVVEDFEREFAAFCGVEHAVGVASGTDAIVLALRALEIGRGDEVIVPANSFIATAEAVSLVGATPRVVDVDPRSGLLTPDLVAAAIGPRTRCVIPVHLYGATVDMRPLLTLARSAGLSVIEDACQAHGAHLPGGGRAGGAADFGCFSFYPTKNLGGWGDGGAVVTSDAQLADRIRRLRSHGEPPGRRNEHAVVGTTGRLDAIQAAVLRVKLARLEGWNEARRAKAALLSARLDDAGVERPAVPADGDHVFHLFVVRADDRDELRSRLHESGIATAIHYPTPIHLTPAYAHLGMRAGALPTAESLAGRICSLPFWPGIELDQIDRVADAVRSATQPLSTSARKYISA